MTSKSPFSNRPPDAASPEADGGFAISRTVTLNGDAQSVRADADARLDEVLRRTLGLKSVLHGCERGGCGACRVIVNGELVASCTLPFAGLADGASVDTAESVQGNERVRVVLQAFVVERNTRCALCLGGLAMTAVHLEHVDCMNREEAIDRVLEGASCACTGRGSLKRALMTVR